jgi:hypothetical protein
VCVNKHGALELDVFIFWRGWKIQGIVKLRLVRFFKIKLFF